MTYQKRHYRAQMRADTLKQFEVCVQETDLMIFADRLLVAEADMAVRKVRAVIEAYIARHKRFLYSLEPIEAEVDAHAVIHQMATAARRADVGPMAAVAGVISEFVGRELLAYSENVIVENGGDIYVNCKTDIRIGLFVEGSVFSDKLKVNLRREKMPMGICTSSGVFGHSLSLGKADAAVVLAQDTALADAAATRLANEIKVKEDIECAVKTAQQIQGIAGVVLIKDERIGLWGDVEIIQ